MNTFMNGLANATNFTYTENGAIKRNTTMNALLDMFALGAAYRTRSEEDCILLFKNAYDEDPLHALRCLFYLRDIRGGQGERRFFRTCMKWLVSYDIEAARRNLRHIPVYGRWDDLYIFVGTALEKEMFAFIKEQLVLDVQSKTPSLLAKWLPSENTSSHQTRVLGNSTRAALNMSHKQYRKTLSILRERINVLERLMSAGKWDEIEFDKIPSRAGLIYRNAFARHDVERMKASKEVQSYADFAKDTTKTVNTDANYPYQCVAEALKLFRSGSYYSMRQLPPIGDTQRNIVNKYWDNMKDYFDGAVFNGLAVVDTSGSMVDDRADAPINVAISLGLYCAERAKGPFAGHYVSFASRPQLIKTEGVDFCDKVQRIYRTNLVDNTNIEATFDLLLNTAIANHCSQDEIPQNLIIISDMEFDAARADYSSWRDNEYTRNEKTRTLMENIALKWRNAGYQMPILTYWNVNARNNNIPMEVKNGIMFVSGMSPSIFRQVLENKNAFDLMIETIDNERYQIIQ